MSEPMIATIDFKPSQVVLRAGAPLVAAMRRAEAEHAAALLVRACHALGDKWQACAPRQIGQVMKDDVASGVEPIASSQYNPFFNPDFKLLVKLGFARFVDESDQVHSPIAFTELGLEALRRWVPHV